MTDWGLAINIESVFGDLERGIDVMAELPIWHLRGEPVLAELDLKAFYRARVDPHADDVQSFSSGGGGLLVVEPADRSGETSPSKSNFDEI